MVRTGVENLTLPPAFFRCFRSVFRFSLPVFWGFLRCFWALLDVFLFFVGSGLRGGGGGFLDAPVRFSLSCALACRFAECWTVDLADSCLPSRLETAQFALNMLEPEGANPGSLRKDPVPPRKGPG